MTVQAVAFILATLAIAWISRSSLRRFRSHGFYRFFAWEAILALVLLNLDRWFYAPLSLPQIVSWPLLIVSLILVVHGFQLLRLVAKSESERDDPALMGFEKTTELVTVGAYRYIRHPLYSSLLFLNWGAFFKHPTWASVFLAALATLFLALTAKVEEAENIRFFGEAYRNYMAQTKMFVPFFF